MALIHYKIAEDIGGAVQVWVTMDDVALQVTLVEYANLTAKPYSFTITQGARTQPVTIAPGTPQWSTVTNQQQLNRFTFGAPDETGFPVPNFSYTSRWG